MLEGKRKKMSDLKKVLGKRAEDVAVAFLRDKGLQIEKRNFRNRLGEIDIITKEGDVFVFVEVKSKSGEGYGSPEEMVGANKQRHIIRTAESYLYLTGNEDSDWRIDVLSIRPKSRSEQDFDVKWIKNAVIQ